MDEVTYTCTRCRRPINAPRSRVLALLSAQRVRCQVCGSALEFPDDVLAEFEVISKTPGSNAVVRRADAECPVCARIVRGDAQFPERVLKCGYCGARMRLPLEASGSRPPPLDGPAASVEDVQRGLLYMPHDEMGEIARHALLARAALGEVAPGEAEMLSSVLAALARWRPEQVPDAFLPLSEAQAAIVVPVILFNGHRASVGDRDGVRELVFNVGRSTESAENKQRDAINVIGAVTFLAFGFGHFRIPVGLGEEVQLYSRIALAPAERGVVLGLSHQLGDGIPQPASAAGLAALREQVIGAAPEFAAYYAMMAIYGSWAQGNTIVAAVPKALQRRLTSLGEPLASRAAQLASRLKPVRTA